jgi:hypothetical protein
MEALVKFFGTGLIIVCALMIGAHYGLGIDLSPITALLGM